MNITFIGLGIMGKRMALNLLQSDATVTVWNRSPEPIAELGKAGAQTAATPAEAVAVADLVLSMLSTPEVVEAVFLGAGGALSHMPEGATWIDCSTVNPTFSLRCDALARETGVQFIDAPVVGTKPHAEKAELTIITGATEEEIAPFAPYLNYMGQTVLKLGGRSRGSAFKMLINTLLAQSMAAFAETVKLGEAMGLPRDFLLDNLPKSPVVAPFLKAKAELIRKGDFEAQFPLEWMQKDLHLATLCAYEAGQPMPLANAAKELYALAKAKGLERADFSAVYKIL
ncbi:MAG: NAD(P)-dependent oxidoreductase [Phaeodactylibacter sp.]|uniref:NAD(P)-dependent oxidoreductase n=1 Tax=Phaeodactylibacter sp. TaxID=1940289 RepID=UPI0032ECEFCD